MLLSFSRPTAKLVVREFVEVSVSQTQTHTIGRLRTSYKLATEAANYKTQKGTQKTNDSQLIGVRTLDTRNLH
jgi:hypothetical protein